MLFLSAAILASAVTTLALPNTKRWYPDSLGANYFMTNGFEGNQLVSSYIMPGGDLVPGSTVWTYGNGSAGINDPAGFANHPDPLYGGKSVVVSGEQIFVVNAGSNTFSVFDIDPTDPARPTLSATYPSYGEFPVSLAASSDGSIVCVLNGGAVNGLACYGKSGEDGGWSEKNSWRREFKLNLTTPSHGPVGGTPSQMTFNREGTELLIAIKGIMPTDANNPTPGTLIPGYIATYTISNDILSDIPTKTPAVVPFSIQEDLFTSGNYFMADVTSGFATYKEGTGNVTQGVIPDQMAACWSVQSNRTKNYYVVETLGLSNVTEVAVDASTLKGTIVGHHSIGNGSTSSDVTIASLPDADYMYVLAPAYKAIHTFKLGVDGFKRTQRFNLERYGLAKQIGLVVTDGFAGQAVYMK